MANDILDVTVFNQQFNQAMEIGAKTITNIKTVSIGICYF
jgi:hypothetical protein